ncbi:MBL fold metallo-hydrolase [Kribbella sp. NBC_00709]|uniref:MBL fold metallo-hydrolase n=1 Tax=Kribbella sp. NBC_00709 TaxID=2975972 RepID=UPI002E2C8304|nr:MBL fold metallo-hydrolase [Kribbella sp. NBC_00709]
MGAGQWDELADKVWFRRYDYGDENVGVIGSGAGLLVVDTRATEVHAQELIADIRKLSDEPIVSVVNTHGHWDHVFGNAAFGDVPIWGHRSLPAFMAATSEPMRKLLMTTEPFSAMATALGAVRMTPPTNFVETEQQLSVGGREIHLRYLGRGHTDGDLIVEIPDCSVTFVGDLVKQNGPPGYRDSYPLEWPQTMRRVIGRLHGPVAPGHGDVTDRSFVESFTEQLDAVAELLRQVIAGERSPEEARADSPVHPRAFELALARAQADNP